MRECSCQQQSILSLYDDMLPYELMYLSHILKNVFPEIPCLFIVNSSTAKRSKLTMLFYTFWLQVVWL